MHSISAEQAERRAFGGFWFCWAVRDRDFDPKRPEFVPHHVSQASHGVPCDQEKNETKKTTALLSLRARLGAWVGTDLEGA